MAIGYAYVFTHLRHHLATVSSFLLQLHHNRNAFYNNDLRTLKASMISRIVYCTKSNTTCKWLVQTNFITPYIKNWWLGSWPIQTPPTFWPPARQTPTRTFGFGTASDLRNEKWPQSKLELLGSAINKNLQKLDNWPFIAEIQDFRSRELRHLSKKRFFNFFQWILLSVALAKWGYSSKNEVMLG